MEYLLELQGVRKTYPGFTLDNVSFRIPRGYIMGLIGPNGAGKTTIIKIIMNLISKEAGDVSVFGMDHARFEDKIKSRIGFVYETPPCYNYLRLKDFASLTAGFYRQWDEKCFRRMADEFDLPLRKKIKNLSRGMKMKFAIALALSHHAELVVMDEPTSGLDPVFRREFLEILSDLLQDGDTSILFSTHITSDLERIADYITLIDNGTVLFSEEKDVILERWAIVRGGNDVFPTEPKSEEGAPVPLFQGYRISEYGFEALTANRKQVQWRFGDQVVVERARLEDILYYLVEGRKAGNA